MNKKLMPAIAVILMTLILLPIDVSAELLDKDASPAVIASSGSFDTTYETRMDFSFNGGDLESAAWTVSQSYAGYTLTGATQVGNAISLELTGTQSTVPSTNPNAKLVFNNLNMVLRFRDADNQLIGDEIRYSSGNVQSSPLSSQLGGTVPENAKTAVITGTFKCRWTTSVVAEESVSVTVELTIEEDPIVAPVETTQQPTPTSGQTTEPVPNQTNESEPGSESGDETSGSDPWTHAGPLATIAISIAAALAAIFGTAIGGTPATGSDSESATADDKDPAYEKSKIPGYPEYVVGQDGEHLSKLANGNIQINYPTGEVATHFPNGTVQVRNPDGSTWEEWPDGTVSTSDTDGFVMKKPDGTLTHAKPNGEEMIYHPDGTSTETTQTGLKMTRDESNQITKIVNKRGNTAVRHPEDPDAFVTTSPHGGSLTYRMQQKWVQKRNSEGKLESQLVDQITIEGEIRTEDMSLTFKPDGTIEGRGDDGSTLSKDSEDNWKVKTAEGDTYEKFADGRENYQGADGTIFRVNPNTGDVEAQLPDGSSVKANNQTGKYEARLPDGSFVKKDAEGSSNFVDTQTGLRGTVQSDGFIKLETDDASLTQSVDGTMNFQTKQGIQMTEKSDGTVTIQLPDGRSSIETADGTKMTKMPDGTVFRKSPDGGTQIRRADGSVQQMTQQDYNREMTRYNDWYNQQLEQWLKNQGQ